MILLALAVTFTVAPPYSLRVLPTGTEPIDACGLVTNSGAVLASGPGASGEIATFPASVPERPNAPDAIVRAFCENSAGRALSLENACLDVVAEDCERICGDVSNDLRISLVDFYLIRQAIARGEASPFCDVTGDRACSLADFLLVREAVAARSTESLEQRCEGVMP